MKKMTFSILSYTLTALCAAALLISCGKDKENDPPATCAVEVTAGTGGTASADKTNPAEGETVTLTAINEPDCIFKQWTVTSGTITLLPDDKTNPATFVMPAGAVSVKAEFRVPYAVEVTAGTGGTASADKTNPTEGETVKLTAIVTEPGYTFKQWTVTSGTITLLPDDKTEEATFVMPAGAVSVEAEFLAPGEAYGIAAVKISAGTFLMGSSDGSQLGIGTPGADPNATSAEPIFQDREIQHRVTLTEDFWMSQYEITNAQYAAFLNAKEVEYEMDIKTYGNGGKCTWGDNDGEIMIIADPWGVTYDNDTWKAQDGYEDYPVVCVTWYGADEYAKWVGGSLPTEAQWEYACRGGEANRPFGVGDGMKLNYTLANFNSRISWSWDGSSATYDRETPDSVCPDATQKVGSYDPNAWGLYDMNGNVREWCSDWHVAEYDSASVTDPTGPDSGKSRVSRGGDWMSVAGRCRSAFRTSMNPVLVYNDYGFRVIFVL